jgi:hypothetical protein
MPPGNVCLVFSMKEIEQQAGEDELLDGVHFFANETWFCIQLLLLAHVTVIQMHCVSKGNESISPQTMNTDIVECFWRCLADGGRQHQQIDSSWV